MISYIIPTMWRSLRILEMLHRYEEDDMVSEVILIDNDTTKTYDISGFKKIVYLPQEKNIYVNPAWNLGASVAKSEYIAICNDDITFDCKLANKAVIDNISESIIGIHPESFMYMGDETYITDGKHVGSGWGVLMYMKRSNYVMIPDEFRVWFGDDVLGLNFDSPKSLTIEMHTEMSTTSKEGFVSGVIESDINNFKVLMAKYNVRLDGPIDIRSALLKIWEGGMKNDLVKLNEQ